MSNKSAPVMGVNQPKTKLGLAKMNKIVAAAEELFIEVGFYQTSILNICKRAKTAIGTFYIYFETKTDIYRYLMQKYKTEIKALLAEGIAGCQTRFEKEREGIKCFIKYAVQNPNVYNIIWGSLAVDRQLFADYYESFAKSYARSISRDADEMSVPDVTTLSYFLMGITNFLGLRAMFEDMDDAAIDQMMDDSVMPALRDGIFKKA